MIMLAHNATILRVPYEWGSLSTDSQGGEYTLGLSLVVDKAYETRQRHEEEMKARMP